MRHRVVSHSQVRLGASLTLAGLALVRGFAATGGGGSVLVVSSSLNASDCAFSDSTALSDGGAVLGLAGSALTFSNCARVAHSTASPLSVWGGLRSN